jgi:hypothetical protein
MDESALATVQKPQLLARKGKHQVGARDKCREKNEHDIYVLHECCRDVRSTLAHI